MENKSGGTIARKGYSANDVGSVKWCSLFKFRGTSECPLFGNTKMKSLSAVFNTMLDV